MMHNFETCESSAELTLHSTRAYIWSLAHESARRLCWEIFAGKHEDLSQWINSLDPDLSLDALRACLLVFSVTDSRIVPRRFQLEAGLAAYWEKNTIVNAGTGSGKTLSMAVPLLMDPNAVAVVISPLKRLQTTQAEELERLLIKPLVINQDAELSQLEIEVFRVEL
jgi:ATP-dependent helicase YprA (DUF1998 family)